MDWSTVLVSTSLSAVVGTLVSLAAVSQTTTRQRRAERRDQARQVLKQTLTPIRGNVRKYQAGMLSSLQRDGAAMHGDDYALATLVLAVADGLHPLRRWLVMRRVRRVLGPFIVETAEVAPMEGNTLGSVAPILMRQYQASKNLDKPQARIGTLHYALMTEPGSPELVKLERDLRRLAAGW